jgi:hypothetical protein
LEFWSNAMKKPNDLKIDGIKTVGQLITALMRFPADAPVAVIEQITVTPGAVPEGDLGAVMSNGIEVCVGRGGGQDDVVFIG